MDFLQGVVADAHGLSEIGHDIRSMARSTTFGIELWVRALDTVLAMPAEQSKLGHLLAVHGNTVLQDPSDEGARLFLRELGDISRKVLEEQAAASRRPQP